MIQFTIVEAYAERCGGHNCGYNHRLSSGGSMIHANETVASLASRSCKANAGKVSRLDDGQIRTLLTQLNGWTLEGKEIARTFAFEDYYETMAFVNATAWISHREDHHPDLEVGYNKCTIRYSTHSVDGLSENDFICAAKINVVATE
jgi:4a-hydroxytetrahydrobiopterin dehydratase